MKLTRKNLELIGNEKKVSVTTSEIFSLPEKVLQFGTGVLLRALPAYFINKANEAGVFNGRIVMVKSTPGTTDGFAQQDNLYTICVKGLQQGRIVEEYMINSSISRVLSAAEQWKEILKCAHNPAMELIISNTTEIGIVSSDDNINAAVAPPSFPGKLLAFLYERFNTFNGAADKGMVIIPTELITNNADKLRSIVFELAEKNNLEQQFLDWLSQSNHFCNSLVDRIVPGKLPKQQKDKAEQVLGYEDELMIMAEPFRLWAIQSDDEKVIDTISFSQVDKGVVIAPSIEKFKELKLRLLNGTHSFTCALAYLAGFNIVREGMADENIAAFVKRVMMLEIAPSINADVATYNEASAFAIDVLDRFMNPFIDHQWLSITLNYSSKMRSRNIPLLATYFKERNSLPQHMTLGFAAFLAFMKCEPGDDGKYYGKRKGVSYLVQDPEAKIFAERAKEANRTYVNQTLADQNLWGTDLNMLPGFSDALSEMLNRIDLDGMNNVLDETLNKAIGVLTDNDQK